MSIVSGIAGASAQKSAAGTASEAQKYAADAASSAQRYMFDLTQEAHQPFLDAGTRAMPELEGADPSAEARPYRDQLEGLPGLDLPEFDYSFDEDDPGYQYRKKELDKTINQASAARGNFGSTATVDALGRANQALTADETDRQFGRKKDIYGLDYQRSADEYSSQYGKITDLYNMSNQLGLTDYNKLIDLTKIGQGAASSAGSTATATGQGLANTYGKLGSGLAEAAILGGQAEGNMWAGIGGLNTAAALSYFNNKPKSAPANYSGGRGYDGAGAQKGLVETEWV